MTAARGVARRTRTGSFDPNAPVRAAAVLQPDEDAFEAFQWLLTNTKLPSGKSASQAEIVRQALVTLYRQRRPGALGPFEQGEQIAS